MWKPVRLKHPPWMPQLLHGVAYLSAFILGAAVAGQSYVVGAAAAAFLSVCGFAAYIMRPA